MTTQRQTHILLFYCCAWITSSTCLYSQNRTLSPDSTYNAQHPTFKISSFRLFNVESNEFVDETSSLIFTNRVTLNKKNPLGLLKLETIDDKLKNNIKYAWRMGDQTEWIYEESSEFNLIWESDKPTTNFIVKGIEANGSWVNQEIRITIENSPKPSTGKFWVSIVLLMVGMVIVVAKYSFSKISNRPWAKAKQTEKPRFKSNTENPESDFLTALNAEIIAHMSDSDFNVDSLSSKLGITTKHLRRQVNDSTSMSLTHYIQDVRLHHAMILLTKHQVNSIKQLSELIGMRDPKYFSKAFKLKFGRPPSEFLRNIHVESESL